MSIIEAIRGRMLDELMYLHLSNNRNVRIVCAAWRIRDGQIEVAINPQGGEWDEHVWYQLTDEQRDKFVNSYCFRPLRGMPELGMMAASVEGEM